MTWKSYLRPENSIIAGVAVMGAVYGLYQLNVGTTAQAAATDANHPILESSRKKAGIEGFILAGGIGLLAKDTNIMILGWATVIAMELTYRHSIMVHPQTGVMQPPNPDIYQPAEASPTMTYQDAAA